MIKRKLSIVLLTSLLTWEFIPNEVKFEPMNAVFAQDASPTLPETLPDGTTVKVETTDSMQPIAEAVQGGFKERYAGSESTVAVVDADTALKDLADGKIDVAAVGRPLTQAEKDQGLIAVPISRQKIVIVVGSENPFDGSLTVEQFAQIFRGEITDWSAVEGQAGSIRFIDRPDSSDTRQAFQEYPAFQEAPFTTGATTEQLSEDNTDLIVEKIGSDGISYAIYDQVKENPGLKIVKMGETLPDNPDYPFSQPLYLVYKGPEASPQVQAFLGYAQDPETANLIEEARISRYIIASPIVEATPEASPSPTETPEASPEATAEVSPTESPVATTPVEEETGGGFPWWLLLIPLLGLLGFFLLRKGEEETTTEETTAPPPPPPVVPPIPESRIILTPRNCREAYAYWEVPEARKTQLKEQGGQDLTLHLYDVTDINIDQQDPHSTQSFTCAEDDPDLLIPIEQDGRDYMVELGYLTNAGEFLSIVRSLPVRVPNCPPDDNIIDAEMGLMDAPPVILPPTENVEENDDEMTDIFEDEDLFAPTLTSEETTTDFMNFVPRSLDEAYVSWQVSEDAKANLRQQGGETLILRLYDLSDVNEDGKPDAMWDHECSETDHDRVIPLYQGDRNYMTELGYRTAEGRWLPLIQSDAVYIPPKTGENE